MISDRIWLTFLCLSTNFDFSGEFSFRWIGKGMSASNKLLLIYGYLLFISDSLKPKLHLQSQKMCGIWMFTAPEKLLPKEFQGHLQVITPWNYVHVRQGCGNRGAVGQRAPPPNFEAGGGGGAAPQLLWRLATWWWKSEHYSCLMKSADPEWLDGKG